MNSSALRKVPGLLVACIALALGCVTSCAKKEAHPTGTILVAMADNSFSPAVARIPVGGSILFHNAGRNDHNAVAADKSWSTESTFGNLRMPPESATEIVFKTQGVYPYYCTYHGTPDAKYGMVGVVVVGDVTYTPQTGGRGTLAPVEHSSGKTLHVPKEYPTIQNAVDAANPGDLVLVDPGVYVEAVFITVPSITVRGVDRNSVILDGKFLLGTGMMVVADGVVIENMTARYYTLNGFYWTGVRGFRGSYLTAYDNGDYGIYAFGATDGVFEHSYASGSPDSSFYVGQCDPCRVVLDDVTGEYSGLGYSGTNSSGSMYVINSRFAHNRSGIGTTTFDIELYPPGHDTVIVGNTITDSGTKSEAAGFYATETLVGNGIVLAGTRADRVERNYIENSRNHGIVILPLLDRHYWPSMNHVIKGNTIVNSGRADLAEGGLGSIGSCFEDNSHLSSLPWGLQLLNRCGGWRLPLGADLSSDLAFFGSIAQIRAGRFTLSDYRTRPIPGPQPNMPGGAAAAVVPAVHAFQDHHFAIESIKTPGPGGKRSARLPPSLFSTILPVTVFQVWYVIYLYLLPILLSAAWIILSILSLSKDTAAGRKVGWSAVLLAIPLLGGAFYLTTRREPEGRAARLAVVIAGALIWLVAVIGAVWLGGGPLGPKALS
ncbi:MAG TPA: right-handed parallel beta-helix repeat-containing protein [Steroidobacteraceae bacterium]|nr:right-handed parallel beta-helix repeat-containing protein [Steroidobacteraceae bacterium]